MTSGTVALAEPWVKVSLALSLFYLLLLFCFFFALPSFALKSGGDTRYEICDGGWDLGEYGVVFGTIISISSHLISRGGERWELVRFAFVLPSRVF